MHTVVCAQSDRIRSNVCPVCDVRLPAMGNGTVRRADRRTHVEGHRHQNKLRLLMLKQKEHMICWEQECRARQRNLTNQNVHLVLLAAVRTRICADYGGINAARASWKRAAQAMLLPISLELQSVLTERATAHVSMKHISAVADECYPVLACILQHALDRGLRQSGPTSRDNA